ncbi:MAG: phosphotyrosine protein phosphatase [Candidatus Woesearchaeota archaeon]
MHLLFICNQGENRSRTAAELFADNAETASAGLYGDKPVTELELIWADRIIVMETYQKKDLMFKYGDLLMKKKPIIILDVPDVYKYKQTELVALLKRKWVEKIAPALTGKH